MTLETDAQNLETLPLIPLRDLVILPDAVRPFLVGRTRSLKAVDAANKAGKLVFLLCQKDPAIDEPGVEQLHRHGVIGRVLQAQATASGSMKISVQALERGVAADFQDEGTYTIALVRRTVETGGDDAGLRVRLDRINELYLKFGDLNQSGGSDQRPLSVLPAAGASKYVDSVAYALPLKTEERQRLLEISDISERAGVVEKLLDREIEKLEMDKKINNEVRKQMEKAQKEYYLNEKIRAIQKELGRGEDKQNDLDELKKKLEESGMPKEAKEKAEQELKRLEMMPPVSAESTVARTYIEWLLNVPWGKASKENRDLAHAEKILAEDHYGLEKIKERIIEFLSVRTLTKNTKGTILCFSGPPGVGKTSLAKSIARATGREFVRLSLGGVRDEAEIRGHRRTYIGAFPGQIIQMMRRAGTVNPVFLLDEIDKVSRDYRGDPTSALLEVLDPEQNSTFMDHYLDCHYDLSQVMFIATANVTHTIPAPLLDRMEVIRLSGYTKLEKLAIAEKFLVPKQQEENGLKDHAFTLPSDTLQGVIEFYTREAGVRNLEREIGNICRKIARQVVINEKPKDAIIGTDLLHAYLGVPRYKAPEAFTKGEVGTANGMAWTEVGGELLQIEIALVKGRGLLQITGQLGDVMQESAKAALTCVRTRAALLGIDDKFNKTTDLHIHVPEGAIPKDGPSAGITMATALTSALTGIPVRSDVSMTGEITLRGRVLKIGGVKEKTLAAYRAGIKEVILPRENEKEMIEDVPPEVKAAIRFHFVDNLDQVLAIALERPVSPLPPPPVVEATLPIQPA